MVSKGGYIAVSESDKFKSYKEEFKGETFDIEITFPKGLGAEHPFDFKSVEDLCKKYGLINQAVQIYVNSIVTDFAIKLKNPNAQALIDGFIHDTSFMTTLKSWVTEGVGKGSGFIEIDFKDVKLRVMNANYMYVRRNKKGKVLGYTQWTKPLKQFDRTSPDMIPFSSNQIAHLIINKIPNEPYGIGLIIPNERIIENLICNEQDLQTIIKRKAGSPYHFKVGQPGENIPSSVVDGVKGKLQYLTNTHEWVTDGDISITAIDFPSLGKSLTEAQMYWFRQLIAGLGIPEVYFGSGQLNEGIAKVQQDKFKQMIKSFQNQIADVIEEKIIRPLLRANNMDEQPIFIWELPTEEDINKKIDILKNLRGMDLHPALKAGIDIEIAKLLNMDDVINYLTQPKDAEARDQEQKNLERQAEAEISQPEVPGAKQNAKESIMPVSLMEFIRKIDDEYCVISHETGRKLGCYKTRAQAEKRLTDIKKFKDSKESDMTIKEWVNLQEIEGFNYIQYLAKILQILKNDPFTDLKAVTEEDVKNGLLPENEVNKLRQVLKDGFKDNQTVSEIEKNIKDNIKLNDRITSSGTISSNNRPSIIARTETVRLANEGLIKVYKDNGILRVRWLSSFWSDRTCERCVELNGQVFEINSGTQPPLHVNCRCSLLSVKE